MTGYAAMLVAGVPSMSMIDPIERIRFPIHLSYIDDVEV
jgi:hypothetical protein